MWVLKVPKVLFDGPVYPNWKVNDAECHYEDQQSANDVVPGLKKSGQPFSFTVVNPGVQVQHGVEAQVEVDLEEQLLEWEVPRLLIYLLVNFDANLSTKAEPRHLESQSEQGNLEYMHHKENDQEWVETSRIDHLVLAYNPEKLIVAVQWRNFFQVEVIDVNVLSIEYVVLSHVEEGLHQDRNMGRLRAINQTVKDDELDCSHHSPKDLDRTTNELGYNDVGRPSCHNGHLGISRSIFKTFFHFLLNLGRHNFDYPEVLFNVKGKGIFCTSEERWLQESDRYLVFGSSS